MALTKPVVGKQYTLTNEEPLGEGLGVILTGTVVTVDAVSGKSPKAGVAGDLVISWVTHQVEVDGKPEDIVRRVSFSLADFGRMFSPNTGVQK